jgi:elongation factor G
LIDTPGHADFTFEVLRSLRILDGAVCILDGVAGVEAQTEKVWYQAQTYAIPKIIFVNKLDRDGAAFGRTVREIASKLHAWPAVCQIPWFEGGTGSFVGVVDVVNNRALRWEGAGDGKSIKVSTIEDLDITESKLAQEYRKARTALVELLSEHDDTMVEKFLESDGDHMKIAPEDIVQSLRRCLLDKRTNIVPVFAGASFRNIGVQPVLDAITSLLPSPSECPDPVVNAQNIIGGLNDLVTGKLPLAHSELLSTRRRGAHQSRIVALGKNLESCALAFKVVNDPKRGVLVYVRVYHGSINRNALLFNTNLQISERAPRLLKMYASDAVEVDSIEAGHIGVITGLKFARTGDTLISYLGASPKTGPPAPLNDLQLRPIDVPPPVFFASIETQSLSEQKHVRDSLALLLREDPSLQLSVDEESGQTLLSGMGELHLAIARDRLVQDLKAKARMGKIEIGYREMISAPGDVESVIFKRVTAGKTGHAGCHCSVAPLSIDIVNSTNENETSIERDGNRITVNMEYCDPETGTKASVPSHLTPTMISNALQNGALAALARGPQHLFAVHNTHVSLTINLRNDIFGADTTPAALSSAARLATQLALKKSSLSVPTTLMEPVMNVIINVDEATLGAVVHDLSSVRGGQILSLDDDDIVAASGTGLSRKEVVRIDPRRVYAPPDPFEISSVAGFEGIANPNRQRTIAAKVPLMEMVGYLKHLRSLTGGRGTFVMSVDSFEKMNAQREKAVLKEIRGL